MQYSHKVTYVSTDTGYKGSVLCRDWLEALQMVAYYEFLQYTDIEISEV